MGLILRDKNGRSLEKEREIYEELDSETHVHEAQDLFQMFPKLI